MTVGYKHLSNSNQFLEIRDARTGKTYKVPTEDGNIIDASSLKSVDVDGKAMMIYDPSFSFTISTKTTISNVNGFNGILEYRGYKIQGMPNNFYFVITGYVCRLDTITF